MLYVRGCCRRRGDECFMGGMSAMMRRCVGEGVMSVAWEGGCRRRGDECCMGGGVVGKGVMNGKGCCWRRVVYGREKG